jgi:hypothetical protein
MELSFRKILRKEQDMAGKWLVWVEIADGEAVILKFQENPTTTKVREEALKYIDNRLKEEENVANT